MGGMTYRLLGAPWAGGHPANPGFVSLWVFEQVLDLCPKLGITHLRFNSGADADGGPNVIYQRELAKVMAARKVGAWMVYQDTRISTERVQAVHDAWWDIYAESGLDPKTNLVIQDDNEAGNFGGGDRLRNAPRDQEGVIPQDRLADIARIARGVNTHGCLMAAPNIEAEKPESLARELASLALLGDALWRFDILTWSNYAGKTQSFANATDWRVKQIRESAFGRMREWRCWVAAEVNREGGKVLDPYAALDEVARAGGLQGAGWFAGFDRYRPEFSLIPVKGGPVKVT